MPQLMRQTYPFKWVKVDFLKKGPTAVFWALDALFDETTPWTFTLQVGTSATGTWTTVGSSTTAYTKTDSTQRTTWAVNEIFYRVKLVTGDSNIYYSLPVNIPDTWTLKDLRIASEIVRKENLLNSSSYSGITFWILSRKRTGTRCTDCTDSVTDEVITVQCTSCWGTGLVGGYETPYETTGRILGTGSTVKGSDLGTIFNSNIAVRYCPLPTVHEGDIIILDGSDERYALKRVETVASIKGHPIIQQATLSALPVSDIVYKIEWNSSYDPTDADGNDFEG